MIKELITHLLSLNCFIQKSTIGSGIIIKFIPLICQSYLLVFFYFYKIKTKCIYVFMFINVLFFQILKEGERGRGPLQGDRVSVHYIGILAEDGSKFDSSRESGKRFEFTIGRGRNL